MKALFARLITKPTRPAHYISYAISMVAIVLGLVALLT